MPLGAFISNHELMISLSLNPALGHITTFGGHPVSCAAGKVAMEVLFEENLMNDVEQKKNLFIELLNHSQIASVNAAGLLLAIEFDDDTINRKVIASCIQNGVVTDWFMFAPHCMRIAPPLIISDEEIRNACSVILHAIDSAQSKS